MKTLHCLELVYHKNSFNLIEVILLMLFKMLANQTKHSRLVPRPVIKFLSAKNYKSYEIYRRIYDMYREVYFNQKMSTDRLKVDLPFQACVKKITHSRNIFTLSKRKSSRYNFQ